MYILYFISYHFVFWAHCHVLHPFIILAVALRPEVNSIHTLPGPTRTGMRCARTALPKTLTFTGSCGIMQQAISMTREQIGWFAAAKPHRAAGAVSIWRFWCFWGHLDCAHPFCCWWMFALCAVHPECAPCTTRQGCSCVVGICGCRQRPFQMLCVPVVSTCFNSFFQNHFFLTCEHGFSDDLMSLIRRLMLKNWEFCWHSSRGGEPQKTKPFEVCEVDKKMQVVSLCSWTMLNQIWKQSRTKTYKNLQKHTKTDSKTTCWKKKNQPNKNKQFTWVRPPRSYSSMLLRPFPESNICAFVPTARWWRGQPPKQPRQWQRAGSRFVVLQLDLCQLDYETDLKQLVVVVSCPPCLIHMLQPEICKNHSEEIRKTDLRSHIFVTIFCKSYGTVFFQLIDCLYKSIVYLKLASGFHLRCQAQEEPQVSAQEEPGQVSRAIQRTRRGTSHKWVSVCFDVLIWGCTLMVFYVLMLFWCFDSFFMLFVHDGTTRMRTCGISRPGALFAEEAFDAETFAHRFRYGDFSGDSAAEAWKNHEIQHNGRTTSKFWMTFVQSSFYMFDGVYIWFLPSLLDMNRQNHTLGHHWSEEGCCPATWWKMASCCCCCCCCWCCCCCCCCWCCCFCFFFVFLYVNFVGL